MATRVALAKIYDEEPTAFLERAVPVLKSEQDSPGFQYLMAFLISKNMFRQVLLDPAVLSVEEAAEVLKVTKRIEPGVEPRLVNELSGAGSPQQLVRLMEVLVHMPNSSSLLPLLTKLMRYPDAYVQSKAALLIGRLTQNIDFVRKRLADGDARVRANAIESIWGETGSEVVSLFEAYASSRENRVRGNAIVGLYLAGQPKAIRLAAQLVESPVSDSRLTGCWVMGFIGDNRFQHILADCIKTADQTTRPRIFQAIRAVKQKREQFLASGALRVFASSAIQKEDDSGLVRIHAFDESIGAVLGPQSLQPTQVHVYDSTRVVFDYSVDAVPAPEAQRVLLLLPWTEEPLELSRARRMLAHGNRWDVAWVAGGGPESRPAAFRPGDLASEALEKPSSPASTLDAALAGVVAGPRQFPVTVIAAVGHEVTSQLLANETSFQPRGERLVIHSLIPEGARSVGHFQLEAASRETGGMVLRYDDQAGLAAQIENAVLSTLGGFDVTYQSPRAAGEDEPDFREVRIQLYTGAGFGEVSALLRLDLGSA